MFPAYEPDWLLSVEAELCYSLHGGSGMHFTRPIREMGIDELEYFLEWLDTRRREEAKAIKNSVR